MEALILAGGLGTRLQPLTYATPKPLLPVGPKPIIEHQIRFLKSQGVDGIVLAVGHQREKIWKYFSSFEDLESNIKYSVEKSKLDTGGCIKKASNKLEGTFLVVNGDILLNDLKISNLMEFHRNSSGLGTILLKRVENPSRFGVVKLEGNRIVEFLEKPSGMKNELINAGLYVFDQEVFDYIPEKKISLEEEVFPKLVDEGELYGYTFEGYWKDIGVMEDYLEAQKDYLRGKIG